MKTGKLDTIKKVLGLSALLLAGLQVSSSYASLISCGADGRTAGLDSAEACKYNYGNGTDDAAAIKAAFAPAAPDTEWAQVGHVDYANGSLLSDALKNALKITVTQTGGTWQIVDTDFWTKDFTSAVIAMHVGGGSVNGTPVCHDEIRGKKVVSVCSTPKIDLPVNFEWLVTPKTMSGTWTYSNAGTGGGLSNWTLWGSGNPPVVKVIEPSPLLLLGFGLLGLGLIRRKAQ